jgi:hypothetical protein
VISVLFCGCSLLWWGFDVAFLGKANTRHTERCLF